MKKLYWLAILLLCLAPSLFAQEHYTEGPVWRVQLIRVKPTQMDAYLASLRQSKNHAAMDGLAAKGEAARDKILGGKQAAQQLGEKRAEIREIISSELLQEIFLK
jgi:hypothetical protein